MEASGHRRAALLALAGFIGGAATAAVYARGIRRAKRLEEVANIREKDIRIRQEHRRKRLLTVGMRKWLVGFRLSASVNKSAQSF